MTLLTAERMKRALSHLDELLAETFAQVPEVTLIVGGGGAMILAHGFHLATSDIDGIPRGVSVTELDPLVKRVASEQELPPDWLNPYFSTFAHTLPPDYGSRLIEIFRGRKLVAKALGREEMLIMKCFAHRQKDVPHAIALIRGGADVARVEEQIERLREKRIPGAQQALDFLDDVRDQL